MVFTLYLAAMYSAVGLPNVNGLCIDFSLQLLPFVGMYADFTNALLNVILFLPLGILLPVLWAQCRNVKITFAVGFFISLCIELLQIFTFRTTDINDIITNVAGTLIGYGVIKWITKGFTGYVVKNGSACEGCLIGAAVVFIMFFMQPVLSWLVWGIR